MVLSEALEMSCQVLGGGGLGWGGGEEEEGVYEGLVWRGDVFLIHLFGDKLQCNPHGPAGFGLGRTGPEGCLHPSLSLARSV